MRFIGPISYSRAVTILAALGMVAGLVGRMITARYPNASFWLVVIAGAVALFTERVQGGKSQAIEHRPLKLSGELNHETD